MKKRKKHRKADITYRMELDFSENTEVPTDETETLVQDLSEGGPRRSERQRRPPDCYGNMSSETLTEPTTIEEATACSEKSKSMQAMATEMKSLKENDVWGAC